MDQSALFLVDQVAMVEWLADVGSMKRLPRSVGPFNSIQPGFRRAFVRNARVSGLPMRNAVARGCVIEAARQASTKNIVGIVWNVRERFPFAVGERRPR